VHACPCGAFHVGPWVLPRRGGPLVRDALVELVTIVCITAALAAVVVAVLWACAPAPAFHPQVVTPTVAPANPFASAAPLGGR
jgi:hypothetical protein